MVVTLITVGSDHPSAVQEVTMEDRRPLDHLHPVTFIMQLRSQEEGVDALQVFLNLQSKDPWQSPGYHRGHSMGLRGQHIGCGGGAQEGNKSRRSLGWERLRNTGVERYTGPAVQQVGHLPCPRLTPVQSPHTQVVPPALAGVMSKCITKSNPRAPYVCNI